VIAWMTGTALTVSLLIVLVLLIRRPVARMFGAHAAYALWAAPLIRAVTPPLPASPIRAPAHRLVDAIDYQLVLGPTVHQGGASPLPLILALWLVPAAAFLAVQLWRHHRFVSAALRAGSVFPIADVDYDVIASGAVEGPVATGLVQPLIFVPLDFAQRYNSEQQRLALLHEQLHHRRGDIWASAAALILTALLWFNPFAHVALGAFRRDMESACDASLVSRVGAGATPTYAETILRSAARPVPRSLCALTAIDELKGRLNMLKANPGRLHRFAGLFIAAGLAAGPVLLAAPASGHPDGQETENIKVVRVVKGDVKGSMDQAELDAKLAKCDNKIEVSAEPTTTGNKKQQSRIVLCGRPGAAPTEVADMLDKAITKLQAESELPAETKAKLLDQLRAKSAELRAKG